MDHFRKALSNLKSLLPLFTIGGFFIAGLSFLNSNKPQLPTNFHIIPFANIILWIIIILGIVSTLSILESLSPLTRWIWEYFTKINSLILKTILKFFGDPFRLFVSLLIFIFILLYLTLNDLIKTINFWIFSLILVISSVVANRLSFKKLSSFFFWAIRDRIFLDSFREQHNWVLNHWGSKSARFENRMMFFEGDFDNSQKEDGSHRDLYDILDIGSKYQVVTYVKSDSGTSGQFRVWCHDMAPSDSEGQSTELHTPSSKNFEDVSLIYQPRNNRNLRIHLQYKPGVGRIYVKKVEIYKLGG